MRDEQGFSLIEVMVILLVMGILLAITLPIVSTVLQTSSRVNVTYSNVDEQLWLSTTLQRLVRGAVAPTPSVTGSVPVPAFAVGTITSTSMTFDTNTGTSRGPEKVVAKCAPTTATGKYCATTATFSVVIYKAEVTPTTHKSFCPVISGTTANHCIYTKTVYNGKSVTITERTVASIPHVRNGTHSQTLFTFAYETTLTATKPPQLKTAASDSIFNTCTAGTPRSTFEHCPAGEIERVTYDLQINQRTTALYGGAQAEDDTGIFVLSSSSEAYDPSVG
jgi:prepilin-type N-terminal cleavage/methylation domain-containing protein